MSRHLPPRKTLNDANILARRRREKLGITWTSWWWWWWLLRQFLGSQTAPLGAHKHVADKSQPLLVHLDRYLALSCARIVRDPSSDLSANDAKQSFHKLCSVHQTFRHILARARALIILICFETFWCFEMFRDVLSQCHLLYCWVYHVIFSMTIDWTDIDDLILDHIPSSLLRSTQTLIHHWGVSSQ